MKYMFTISITAKDADTAQDLHTSIGEFISAASAESVLIGTKVDEYPLIVRLQNKMQDVMSAKSRKPVQKAFTFDTSKTPEGF